MIKYYLGKWGSEQFLCSDDSFPTPPKKGDFIFYNTEPYKVMYTMYDIDHEEICVFVRMAVEEDY